MDNSRSQTDFLGTEVAKQLNGTSSTETGDAWFTEAYARDTETLTKALQMSLSRTTTDVDSFSPFPDLIASNPREAAGGVSSEPETPPARRNLRPTGKVSKRKSRASKRSQTTFITADPANFRQMVQQVTGVRFAGGGGGQVDAGGLVRPEPQRPGQGLVPVGFLPTLDTAAFLLDRYQRDMGGVPVGPVDVMTVIEHHHHQYNKDFRGIFSPSFESPSTSAVGDDFFFGDGHDSYGNPDSELSNIINDCGICIPTGADEHFVDCLRLATFHSKTADLLLLLIPSRSIALNLRAECLVKVYLPGSKDALVQNLVSLKLLDLSYSSFTRMPDLSRACKMQSLDLHCCKNLVDVSSIQYLTKLEYIDLKGCTSLMRLPSLMALKFLMSLDVSDCINLRRLPPSLGCLSSLAALDLSNCKRIQNLPKGILRLKSVQTLSISGCTMLMKQASGPDGMLIEKQVNPIVHSSSHASDEQTLSISGCSMLMERASDLEGMVIEHQVNPIAHSSSHASDEEVSMSYLPVDKYVSKIPLQQPEEEIIISKYNSVASKDAAEPSSTTEDLELHKEVLKAYMNMPVEAINQANAFYCVQRTVDSLIRRNPNSHENASLRDLTYCLEELQESVPETMSRMHDARVSKASIQVKLAHLHSSFVQSEGHYNGLAARFSVISDEEEDLDAEIDRLLVKRRELLD